MMLSPQEAAFAQHAINCIGVWLLLVMLAVFVIYTLGAVSDWIQDRWYDAVLKFRLRMARRARR